MSASRSASGPGTASDSLCRSAKAAFARGSAQPANAFAHADDGYTGTNVSGKTTSAAPCPAASAVRSATRSIVPARSRIAGSTCTQATVTGPFM